MKIKHYFDYKSPYAYLAQPATFALAAEPGVEVEWLPYTLDITKFLGAAKLDASGHDTIGTRNEHQWRRVKYTYMDCRREANREGLTIRGPRKIFDSAIAHIGFLYVRELVDFRAYHDIVYERFWTHELDIEDARAIASVIEETGSDPSGFTAYLHGAGRAALEAISDAAEANGVFGVPSYLIDEELFWGLERLERVREMCARG